MKKWILVVAVCLVVRDTYSQTFKEWFRQKKTQIEYLEKQIVALQVYIELGQKGYSVYQDGLGFIGDLKKGELNLHSDHFALLKSVKPSIGQSKTVAEIFQWQHDIGRIGLQSEKLDLGQYKQYVRDVFNALNREVENCGQETRLLTTDGYYQLSDDERIRIINERHEQMQEFFEFATWMGRQVAMIFRGGQQDQKDARVLQ